MIGAQPNICNLHLSGNGRGAALFKVRRGSIGLFQETDEEEPRPPPEIIGKGMQDAEF